MPDERTNLPALTAQPAAPAPAPPPAPAVSPAAATQLKDLPLSEVQAMARDYGLDPHAYETKPGLVAAILDRRTMIAGLDRDAMLDVLAWAGRTVTANMSRDRLAMEIVNVRSMRFSGLSQRGLVVLARLRGVQIRPDDATPDIIAALKGQEGLFQKLARKRRQMVGRWVSRMLGETPSHAPALPDQVDADPAAVAAAASRDPLSTGTARRPGAPGGNAGNAGGGGGATGGSARPAGGERKLQDEIEESGLIAGLTSRMRRSADQYLNQKLDEIEARIDRKLDEIDRRLAEWRDKEVANRIRILKISLWATVVVGAATLIISYVRVHMPWLL